MMAGFVVAGALPILALLCAIAPRFPDDGRLAWPWRAVVAVGLGIGLSSLVWGSVVASGFFSRTTALVLDVTVWLAIAAASVRFGPRPERRERTRDGGLGRPRPATVFAIVMLALAAGLAVASFAAQAIVLPHGIWDAWGIWNLKARFVARGAFDGFWTDVFDPTISWSHPNYPLLLPLVVARGWTYTNSESVWIPIAYAALFSAGIVATVGCSIARARTPFDGLMAATFVCASPAFVKYAPSLTADVPLSYFMVLTFALIAEAECRDNESGLWGLAGLASGLAAWTKNEGGVILIAIGAGCAIASMRRALPKRAAAAFVLGAIPAITALAILKGSAPADEIVNPQTVATLFERLADYSRLRTILTAVGIELWFGGAATVGVLPVLGVYLLIRRIRPDAGTNDRPAGNGVEGSRARRAPVYATAAIVASLAADTLVYIITPVDLSWHLRNSLDRLIVQLLPSIVWTAAMVAGTSASPMED